MPLSLALAVAEVESHFDMDAVGSAGEVGIMQLNPGPENTYWINLEAETNQDPTTPAGNIVCGVYLLGAHLVNYGDTEKAVMAYNMGNAGAERAWENGVTSTEHSEKVMEAMARWEAVGGLRPFNFTDGPNQARRGAEERARFHRWNVREIKGHAPGPRIRRSAAHIKPGGDYERGGGVGVRLGEDPGRRGVGRGSFGAGGGNARTL